MSEYITSLARLYADTRIAAYESDPEMPKGIAYTNPNGAYDTAAAQAVAAKVMRDLLNSDTMTLLDDDMGRTPSYHIEKWAREKGIDLDTEKHPPPKE